jgi:hypothetical protein
MRFEVQSEQIICEMVSQKYSTPRWVLVAHMCNPTYSGGRDQEDCGSKQPRQIVLETLSQKNPSQKGSGGVDRGVGPEFKPQY